MSDSQAEVQDTEQMSSRPSVDKSINIEVGPGGLSFIVVGAMVCLTVWCIFVGMGEVDPSLVEAWLRG